MSETGGHGTRMHGCLRRSVTTPVIEGAGRLWCVTWHRGTSAFVASTAVHMHKA